MKQIICTTLAIFCLIATSACEGGDREDLKSPCVGTEGSPCGERRMVNDWWLA